MHLCWSTSQIARTASRSQQEPDFQRFVASGELQAARTVVLEAAAEGPAGRFNGASGAVRPDLASFMMGYRIRLVWALQSLLAFFRRRRMRSDQDSFERSLD